MLLKSFDELEVLKMQMNGEGFSKIWDCPNCGVVVMNLGYCPECHVLCPQD